jgi:serine protease Do
LSVVVAEVEADKSAAKVPAKEEKPKASTAAQVFGLAVADLTEAQKKESGLKGGVRVEAATDAAARAGLREGDVILQAGNVEVGNVKEFEAVVGKFDKSKALSVLFRRGEWTQYAILKVSK